MAEFEKPSNTEDDYFAREEIEKKRKLAFKARAELAAAEKKKLKELHKGHCPNCGMKMQTVKKGPIEVDSCFNCGGIFLDQGELEALVHQRRDTHPVMEAILNWVKK